MSYYETVHIDTGSPSMKTVREIEDDCYKTLDYIYRIALSGEEGPMRGIQLAHLYALHDRAAKRLEEWEAEEQSRFVAGRMK